MAAEGMVMGVTVEPDAVRRACQLGGQTVEALEVDAVADTDTGTGVEVGAGRATDDAELSGTDWLVDETLRDEAAGAGRTATVR